MASNLVTVIMVYDTAVPIPLRAMCATPNLVLTNIMACRVYRKTKVGLFKDVEASTSRASEKNRKPIIPIAVHTASTRVVARSDPHYHVDIELPNLPTSYSGGNKSRTDDGPNVKTYEGSLSASTTTTHEHNPNYQGSFLDIEKGRE